MNNSMNNQTGSQNKTQNTKDQQDRLSERYAERHPELPRRQGFQDPEHALTYFRGKNPKSIWIRIFYTSSLGSTMVKRLPTPSQL